MTATTPVDKPHYLCPPELDDTNIDIDSLPAVLLDTDSVIDVLNPLNWVQSFELWVYSVYDYGVNLIGLDNKWYPQVIYFLALLTFGLIPLNILTNYFLSYRLDPAKFFNTRTGYDYSQEYTGFMLFSFWAHKVNTILWTCFVISHVLILTLWGTRFRNSTVTHQICGITVVISSFLAAVFGLIIKSQHGARYDQFTEFFLIFPTVVVFISAPAIAILRSVPALKAYKALHAVFGYFLLLPPLAMMIQFLTYSAMVATGWFSNDFTCWKTSMYISCIAGTCSEILFSFHAYYFGQLRLHHEKQQAEINARSACECAIVDSAESVNTLDMDRPKKLMFAGSNDVSGTGLDQLQFAGSPVRQRSLPKTSDETTPMIESSADYVPKKPSAEGTAASYFAHAAATPAAMINLSGHHNEEKMVKARMFTNKKTNTTWFFIPSEDEGGKKGRWVRYGNMV